MKKEMLIDMLVEKGWFHQEDFLDQNFCLELLAEARNLEWKQAKIGKGDQKQEVISIRSDSIVWIEEENATPAQKNYLTQMNDLMGTLNHELYLGLKEYECHFAQYSASGFYKKHLDQHTGSNTRVVSSVLYLNEPKNGGELVIYNRDNPEVIEKVITPRAGSFVCFLSNQIYHEVLPTESERFSLTGWFRNTL